MPTKNPRLTMTLSPTLAAQLRRLSELTGNSQAAIISELLEGQEKVFSKLIRVLEAARSTQEAVRVQFGEDLAAAEAKLEEQLGLVLDTLDEATAPLLAEAEKIHRRAHRSAPARTEAPAAAEAPARRSRTPTY